MNLLKKLMLAALTVATQSYANPCYYLEVDYLLWRASQNSMTYALGADSDFDPGVTAPPDTKDISQAFDWRSGFRLEAGYLFPCSGFDLSLSWTNFDSNFSQDAEAPFIIATETLGVTISNHVVGHDARSNWRLHLDMIDLNLGYLLWDAGYFELRPYIGIKGGRIEQQQTIHYNNFIDEGNSNAVVNATIRKLGDFYGGGPKFGMSGSYFLWNGWFLNDLRLVGNIAGSLLYGRLHAPTKFLVYEPANELRSDAHFKFDHNELIPTVQMFIGLNWERGFCQYFLLDFGIGYEVQYFWNTWRSQRSFVEDIYLTDTGRGNLLLQGITAKMAMIF